MITWKADDTPEVDARYPPEPVHFSATRRQMIYLFGYPNSTDDPNKTTIAFDCTDGQAWVHCYDHAEDWPEATPDTTIGWSAQADTEGAAERFGAFVEANIEMNL